MKGALDSMYPYVQAGFAGFAFVLLILLFLLVWRFISAVKHSTEVIAGNTQAIRSVCEITCKVEQELESLRNLFQERPCLLLRSHTLHDLHEMLEELKTRELANGNSDAGGSKTGRSETGG